MLHPCIWFELLRIERYSIWLDSIWSIDFFIQFLCGPCSFSICFTINYMFAFCLRFVVVFLTIFCKCLTIVCTFGLYLVHYGIKTMQQQLPLACHSHLQDKKPRSHAIIEAHPDVLAEMERKGWNTKPGVTIHRGQWQDIVAKLPPASFDAINYDTWDETYVACLHLPLSFGVLVFWSIRSIGSTVYIENRPPLKWIN